MSLSAKAFCFLVSFIIVIIVASWAISRPQVVLIKSVATATTLHETAGLGADFVWFLHLLHCTYAQEYKRLLLTDY